jgi:hypothetical protein
VGRLDTAVSSRLAYPEVRAALAAAGRAHRLDPTDQSRAEAAWEDYWAATRMVELTELVSAHAGQLASLLAVGGAETLFAAWDQRLRAGAQAAGVQLAPVVR